MRGFRLLLTIVLPMIGGALAGATFRGDFFGGYVGMIGGLFFGIMAAVVLFTVETLFQKSHPITPIVVGLLAAVAAYFGVQLAFQPPPSVIYHQHFGSVQPESVDNLQAAVVYHREDLAILLRFNVAPEDLPALLEHRDLKPQPDDEPVATNLDPFNLPDWWDLAPHADHIARYYTVRDFAEDADRDYENAPPPPEDHTPANQFFARPGQLYYDSQTETAYYFDRSYWIEPSTSPAASSSPQ
ncbi:MAG: hypothetical protein WD294_11645 [Phycisphaeraceae bacterium]